MFSFVLSDLLEKHGENYKKHPALILDNQTVNYGELQKQVVVTASWLHRQGIRRGDRVGIHLPKSIKEVVAIFAAARVGAIFVNIHPQWKISQLNYVINDCDIRLLFTTEDKANELLNSAWPPCLEKIVVPTQCNLTKQKLLNWPTVLDDVPSLPAKPVSLDPATLIYTSGSTGKPKGVIHSHGSMVHFARNVAFYLENHSTDRVLGLLPLSSGYGLSQLLTLFMVGGTLVLQESVYPPDILNTLLHQKITGLAAVPPLWNQLLNYLDAYPVKLPALRYVTNAGGKPLENLLQAMLRHFPAVKVYLMYGSTEGLRTTYLPPELFKAKMGAIGLPIPDTEVFVIDSQKGLCGPGEVGELVQRSNLVCMGYWKNSQATTAKIRPSAHLQSLIGDEKVLFTGDLVKRDEQGILWYVSRADTLIKSRGFRIGPEEIEDMVHNSGLVGDVVAFGVEDDLLGEVIHIAVSPYQNKDSQVDLGALQQYCRENMPPYMLPHQIHCWDNALPRNANGKLDRMSIIQTCQKQIVATDQTDNIIDNTITPSTPEEKMLCDVCRSVLNIREIRVTDDLVALGIDSLLSLRLMFKLKSKGLKDELIREILSGNTIKEVAAKMASDSRQSNPSSTTQDHNNISKHQSILHTNEAINAVRGIAISLIIFNHWIGGFLNDFIENQELIRLLKFRGTPIFALAFGLFLAYLYSDEFQSGHFHKVLKITYSRLSILLLSLLLIGLPKYVRMFISGDFSSTAFVKATYNIMNYYLLASLTLPLLLYLIFKFKRRIEITVALAVMSMSVAVYLRTFEDWSLWQTGWMLLIKLNVVGYYGYFNLLALSLVGVAIGIGLKYSLNTNDSRSLYKVSAIGFGSMLIGILLGGHDHTITGFRILFPQMFFHIGISLLVILGMLTISHIKGNIGHFLLVARNLLSTVGIMTLPVFILHGYVIPVRDIFMYLSVPKWISSSISLTVFFLAMWWLARIIHNTKAIP